MLVRELNENDEAAFNEGMKLWEGEDLAWYTFSWKPGMAYSEMLAILAREKAGVDMAANRVPHTMLYGFVDGKIVGRVSVRHELNEHLRHRGGHLGYAVAKPYRRRGYATELMSSGLDLCRNLKIPSVMITCGDSNTASWKIIERFGGQLQDKIWDAVDEETIRRYWIDLRSPV
jgi:predicted acetyltransferase